MKRVLLIQEGIPYYRVPIYNELAKRVELTVLYANGDLPEDTHFRSIKSPAVRFANRYSMHKTSICKLARNFDVVIVPFLMSYIPYKMLPKLPRKYKVIYWSIGVAAAYNTPYDGSDVINAMFLKYLNRPDACLFYSSYPVEKYAKLGFDKNRLFVANNTVQVIPAEPPSEKNNIIFVGSLYKQKKIYELLENYNAAYGERQDIPDLIIIGGGDEYEAIKAWIAGCGLTEKIALKGEISDEKKLSEYFGASLACISPGQAGLSVLKSMGYGVPFVTTRNAVTGGEIFNIENKVNGVILDSYSEIKNIILEIAANKEKYILMGCKAQTFYEENRQVSMMVDGFEQAINFVCKNE